MIRLVLDFYHFEEQREQVSRWEKYSGDITNEGNLVEPGAHN